jgi:hypothetical protein
LVGPTVLVLVRVGVDVGGHVGVAMPLVLDNKYTSSRSKSRAPVL